jgi:hypothetical protein
VNQLYEILVPCQKNPEYNPWEKNRFFSTKYHQQWDSRVRSLTGGLTIMRPATGQWISNDGKLYVERNIPVKIMCDRSTIEKIAHMTCCHYHQLAVFYYKISDECYIYERQSRK